ncbi:amidase family protein, partial [Gammaproteobacteria bacterium]|nr:amidase family protein [Gammaproteobacteria bacterium]
MDLLFKSAFEIAEYVKTKAVSSREVVSFYLDRIETFNPQINAVVQLDAERALLRADAADKAIASGQDWGPLHGLPVTIKDAYLTEGIVTANGIPALKGNVP